MRIPRSAAARIQPCYGAGFLLTHNAQPPLKRYLGEIMISEHPPIPALSTNDPVVEAETAIALLADIDARYERERDALDKWSGSERAKKRMLERLQANRQAEREPVVERALQLRELLQRKSWFPRD
jgi:hypothetical protein